VRGDEPVVGQVARQPDLEQVVVVQQPRPLLVRRAVDPVAVGIGEQPGREALPARVVLERAAAPDRVAQPVVEGADAGADHPELGRLREPGVVDHLAEVPALAVHQDRPTVDAVPPRGQPVQRGPHGQDVGLRVVAHEVEPETVHFVLCRPAQHRVDHQLAHHRVLGRGVGAAGGVGHPAVVEEPVVVAGHDPVQDGVRVHPGGRGVVVDHVHDHA
jgi:hypothetical protein